MMNSVEKFHALLVSDKIFVWHYPYRAGQKFVYILNIPEAKENWFDTLESMVDEAYKHIDPLLTPLPDAVPKPSE